MILADGWGALERGRVGDAERIARERLALEPADAEAHNLLGIALANQGRHAEAAAAFRAAVDAAPRSAEANNNLANALSELGRHDEAIPYLQRLIEAKPDLAEAHHNLGTVFQTLRRHAEAIACFERAARLAPGMSYTQGYLVWNKLAICRWDGLAADVERLRAQVREGIAAAPFAFLAVSDSPAEQRQCAEAHVREQLPPVPPAFVHAGASGRRIRVAYLSADYAEHATAYVMCGLFEQHDRSAFEVLAFSYGADDGSPMRRRLERAFDRFVDVRTRGDEEIARLLHEAGIDIAVDLKGHTTGARPSILASRPAPVQASYMGYPATSALTFIDYLVADRTVVPPEEAGWYSERLVWLPDCYWVNDATRPIAARVPTRTEAGLPEGAFVFCCFNNVYKIAPPVFAIWMRLLAALPGSVLWLLADNPQAKRNLQAAAQAAGVEASRLVFAQRVANDAHLARHRLADLFLDTLPYNAHTTATDALWAGLPVLTCRGSTFVGRVAASLLGALGLPELVAGSAAEYEALALRLARDPELLRAVKKKIDANLRTAPLFDTARFCRNMEAAYRAMHERRLAGAAPESFAVEGGR